ncbi:MAG: DUF1501 domain-containing protein [Planctomycetota bacterium]
MKRRKFLTTLGASSLLVPALPTLDWTSFAAVDAKAPRTLVLLELNGGNDGLNTIIPLHDPLYARYRPKLALPRKDLFRVNDDLGWHPRLNPLSKAFEKGGIAVVNNVGYPSPNRSHFRSMDIWHSGIPDRVETQTGWLGRALARQAKLKTETAKAFELFSLGSGSVPLAFAGAPQSVTALSKLEDLAAKGGKKQKLAVEKQLGGRASGSKDLDFIQKAARGALDMGERLEQTKERLKASRDKYPQTTLGRELRLVAALIRSGFDHAIYHVRLSGFDTHALQDQTHPPLLGIFASALQAFMDEIASASLDDRVMTVAFSEFGRRVRENASSGTDHGAAGPMIIAGGKAKAGVFGGPINLEDLAAGDLKARVDFRSVWGSIGKSWLNLPLEPTFGPKNAPAFLA